MDSWGVNVDFCGSIEEKVSGLEIVCVCVLVRASVRVSARAHVWACVRAWFGQGDRLGHLMSLLAGSVWEARERVEMSC